MHKKMFERCRPAEKNVSKNRKNTGKSYKITKCIIGPSLLLYIFMFSCIALILFEVFALIANH